MTMPWLCFICGSDQHSCGHREPELIEWARTMAVRIVNGRVISEKPEEIKKMPEAA